MFNMLNHLVGLFVSLLFFFALGATNALQASELIDASRYDVQYLEPGDENSQLVHLGTKIHFYSSVYDHIYINTNGILSFGAEYTEFANQPFPLEYPSIAPFYANIDTTNAAISELDTSISYFESNETDLLHSLVESINEAFAEDTEFEAVAAFVVTWTNVGYYRANSDRTNTFQVIVCSSLDKSYVQFRYPEDGLNWIQADIGESGLVDVRAQAGFVSEDGRFWTLPQSGTDNVKYLSALSNYDEKGSWWFIVGPLTYDSNIIQPLDNARQIDDPNQPPVKPTCATHGMLECHVEAICTDNELGFCCTCRKGYYGNGYNCLKKNIPVRISGQVSGTVNGEALKTRLQAYVSVEDGRTYTAVTQLSPEAGFTLQLLQIIAGPIGWLFAVPTEVVGDAKSSGSTKNGYELTGGKFNHTANIRFHGSDKQIEVRQSFTGMDAWDQLEVNVELDGELPETSIGTQLVFPDLVEEFVFAGETTLRSIGTNGINVTDGNELTYSVIQQIDYEKCPYLEPDNYADRPPFFNKAFRVTSAYSEKELALRIGMTNKITGKRDSSPCTDGTAKCGANTFCVSSEHDMYECTCKNGYMPTIEDGNSCGDIDECADGSHICDPNAECMNNGGGYSCRCLPGFLGNGYTCRDLSDSSAESAAGPTHEQQQYLYTTEDSSRYYAPTPSSNDYGGSYVDQHAPLSPENNICADCSTQADCVQNSCVCRAGFEGDGYECHSICELDEVWDNDRCVTRPEVSNGESVDNDEEEEESELEAFCNALGCTCSTGYEKFEYSYGVKCRRIINPPLEATTPEEDRLPCDAEYNCSPNATCEWIEADLQNRCICKDGYTGDGYECQPESCLIKDNCHPDATCVYSEHLGKSVCKCGAGFDGDGFFCEPGPECRTNDQCDMNAICVDNRCECESGFEMDASGFCVQSGLCGGVLCATNAICEWDTVDHLHYCVCPDGYQGDGLHECVYVPPPCNVINNCGLNAACTPDYRNSLLFQCVCNEGFNGDGFVCVPEENCENTPTLCHPDAQCESTTVGLQCVCRQGFVGNGTQCDEPPQIESGFLLLSRGLSTIRVPFDGRNSRPILMSHLIMDLDKDCTKGRVYWSDITAKCIMSALYDGTDKRPFITDDIMSPEGVAVDWISRRIYWTDSEKDTVEVASLDDPKQRAVIVRKDLVNPRGIAVDPSQKKIYWSDWNRIAPKIEWANLDGSDRQILLAHPEVQLPNYVAVSPNTGELCYSDAGTKKVECIDAYRREVRTVAANLTYPFGLAVTPTHYYWTDWTTKKIETVDVSGTRLPAIFIPIFSNHKMYGLTAITSECPLYYSPCQVNNGGCATNRVCLAHDQSTGGRNCVCQEAAHDCTDDQEVY